MSSSGRHFWERTVVGWHLAFAALLVAAAVAVLLDGTSGAGARTVAIALLAVWGVCYVVLGRRLWAEPDPRRRWAYLLGLLVCCGGAAVIAPASSLSFFAAIPQIYAIIDRLRTALSLVCALFLVFAVSLIGRGADPEVVTQLGFSALFSVVLGSWIGGIIQQSLQRAQLIDELREAREELAAVNRERGALAERERLSRDIHDTLAQGFASIVTLLEAVDAELGAEPGAEPEATHHRARRHVALARETARENLAETRSLVTALYPAGLSGTSLVEALDRLAVRWEAETRVPVTFTVSGAPRPLTPAAEVVLLRAGQEGLANVGKHAGAERVELHLEHRADSTLLRVRDDGRGFDPVRVGGPVDGLGYGLAGMRARALEAGGSLRLHSTPGAGTTIELEVR